MKIEITNFNMIPHAEVELNGLTVIAGENDTGKSTIGKLLFSIIKEANRYNFNRGRTNVLDLVFENYSSSEAVIRLEFENEDYMILGTQNGLLPIQGSLKSFEFREATYIESPVVWSLIDFFTSVGKLREEDSMYGIESELNYPYLLWDLYRKLIVKRKVSSSEESDYSRISKEINHIVGGDFQRTLERFSFNRISDHIQFPISTIATGIKSFGILSVLIQNQHIYPGSILIIDEPEVHLHPKWEVEYAKIICWLAEQGVKIVVTTHSLYMVKALREFSKSIPKQTHFYLTHKEFDESVSIENVTQEIHKIFKKFADPLQDIAWRNKL